MIFGSVLLMVAALINFVPVVGVISGAQIEKMYAIDVSDPNVEILMRHRAVLFGLVGGVMIWGVFERDMFMPAAWIGLISMVSYLAITLISGPGNPSLRKVFRVDIVGIVAVLGAIIVRLMT